MKLRADTAALVGLALISVAPLHAQTAPSGTELTASLSWWLLHPATATTYQAHTRGVTLSATHWSRHWGVGGYGLLAPARDDTPTLFGLGVQLGARSSRNSAPWRPFVYGAAAAGLLDVAESMLLVQICEISTGRCQFTGYHEGWQPFLAVSTGLEVPLPWRTALSVGVGADIGGPFWRWGVGLTVRP